jgi:hypothetical protein
MARAMEVPKGYPKYLYDLPALFAVYHNGYY